MNTPCDKALIYRVSHDEAVDYSKATPLEIDHPDFKLTVEDGKARFELKKDYPTEQDARAAVAPFIGSWEVDAGLTFGPGKFELEFDQAEGLSGSVSWSFSTGTPTLSVGKNSYPRPPTGFDGSHPDVRALYQRYKGYQGGEEGLPAFAFFCLTVLVGEDTRAEAAGRYGICREVLDQIGTLSSEKGGSQARKVGGINCPLSDADRRFLEAATVRLIRRLAEYHGNGQSADGLSKVGLDDIDV